MLPPLPHCLAAPFGSTVDELLGCHFDLGREDMLGPVRTDLKKGVGNTQPMKTLCTVHVTGVHRDEVVMSFELHEDHACHKMSDDRKRDFGSELLFCACTVLCFALTTGALCVWPS